MSYTYYEDTGLMVRDSDGFIVQPQIDEQATAEYQAWLANGGIPNIVAVMPQG